MKTEVIKDNLSDRTKTIINFSNDNYTRKRQFKKRVREVSSGEMRKTTPIHESEANLCTAIWRSVIVQALYDICGEGGNEARKLNRAEANAWLANLKLASNDNGSNDFEFVCEMANLSPALVLRIVKEVREKGEIALKGYNSRSFRKKYSTRLGRRVLKK